MSMIDLRSIMVIVASIVHRSHVNKLAIGRLGHSSDRYLDKLVVTKHVFRDCLSIKGERYAFLTSTFTIHPQIRLVLLLCELGRFQSHLKPLSSHHTLRRVATDNWKSIGVECRSVRAHGHSSTAAAAHVCILEVLHGAPLPEAHSN